MGIWEIVAVFRRRWLLATALLIVTLSCAVGSFVAFPKKYEMTASFVLLPSANEATSVGGNPYLAFEGSLSITADIVSRALAGDEVRQQLVDQGATSSFTIALATDSNGPLLTLTAQDRDPAAVQRTLDLVSKAVPARLADLQAAAGATGQSLITVTAIASDAHPRQLLKTKVEVTIVVAVLGLGITYLTPLISEARRARRAARGGEPDDEPTDGQGGLPAGDTEADTSPGPADLGLVGARLGDVEIPAPEDLRIPPYPSPFGAPPGLGLPARPAHTGVQTPTDVPNP